MAVFILPVLSVGFIAGLVTGFSWSLPGLVVVVVCCVSLILSLGAWLYQLKLLFITSLFLLGMCLGVMSWVNAQQESQFDQLFSHSINLQARVVAEPTQSSGGNQLIYLQPENFTQLIRVSLFEPVYVKQGQMVIAQGVLEAPENFSEFNYIKYLEYRGVFAELKRAKIMVVDHRHPWYLKLMRDWRNQIIRKTQQRLDKISAGIVLGVLVGQREQLPDNLQEAYRRVGLIHILVVSGYNLTVLASAVGIAGYVLGRRWTDLSALIMIWLFVILVGADSPVVRAGIMASVLILSRSVGRLTGSYVLLLYAVTAMAVFNPLRIFYDIGLQLSVAATFGVLTANRLRILFEKTSWWSELTWSSSGAILATTPLIAKYFGTFSLVAPVANAAVLPTIPLLMLSGALVLVPWVGKWSAVITELLVSVQVGIVNLLANLSFSQIELHVSTELVLAYYVCTLSIIYWVINSQSSRLKKSPQDVKMTKIII